MKAKRIAAFALFAIFTYSVLADPVGSEFTYQGELQTAGMEADGPHDFKFSLYSVENGGSPVASDVEIEDVLVSEGIFSVFLDFGLMPFTSGEQLWLEIAVRDGASMDPHTALSPRQKLTAIPTALSAITVPDESISTNQIDPTSVQRRVSDACSSGFTIRAINQDGSVVCEPDSDTTYSEGFGIDLSGNVISVDDSEIQERVTGTCSEGSAIRIITPSGTVACEPDTNTTYLAGEGLTLSSNTFAVDPNHVQLRIVGTCDAGEVMTGVNADGSVNCEQLGPVLPFTLDGHDAGLDVGARPSIAIRGDGIPVIAYRDRTNESLKVFICGNEICSAGTPKTLDDSATANIGAWNAIAIGLDGFPVIAYTSSTPNELRVYKCTDVDCNSGGAVPIDTVGATVLPGGILIRASGNPQITYYDSSGTALKFFHCSAPDCSSGTDDTLESTDIVGLVPSMGLRSSGNPIVAYRDATNAELKVYDCSNAGCGAGTPRTIEPIGIEIHRTATVVSNVGSRPLIAYVTGSPDWDLRLFVCSNSSCTGGTSRSLDSGATVQSNIHMIIGSDGFPIISYVDASPVYAAKLYYCADALCSSGEAKFATQNGEAGAMGAAVAVGSEGNPLIAYYGMGYLGLKACTDYQCSR